MSNLTLKEAQKELRKAGTSHAGGDALRAMYARLIIEGRWPGLNGKDNVEKVYAYLQREAKTDDKISDASREMLRDYRKALDVVLGD